MLSYKDVFRVSGMISLLCTILVLPCQGEENTDRKMELVWSQSDGLRQEIYHSSYAQDTWSDPVKLTDNDANNLHPVLDVSSDGTTWAFWSAVRWNGISIEYAVKREKTWSEPQAMELDLTSAITPSVLVDDNGVVWLAWAGNGGGQDEIYYSRYIDSKWQAAKTVNAPNEVPDIKPELSLNEKGDVELKWIGFRDNMYRLLSSSYSYTGSNWSAEQVLQEEQEVKEEDEILKESKIGLPGFLPGDSQYSLKVL